MACSHFTGILIALIAWTVAAVNSTAIGEVSSVRESHLAIPETIYWSHSQDKRSGQQVCGSRLVQALRALCNGRYAGLTRRSDPALRGVTALEDLDYHEPNTNDLLLSDSTSYQYGNHELENSPNDFDLLWPYNPKLMGLKVMTEGGATHQRFRRSITEECCNKPCTRHEMQKYCGRQ